MRAICLKSAIKVAPMELISTLTSYYKQFAPTELEKNSIRIQELVYEAHYSFYKRFIYIALKKFNTFFQAYTRGSWSLPIKVAPTELIGTFTSYKQFAPTELEKDSIRMTRSVCEGRYYFYNQAVYPALEKNSTTSIKFDARGSWTVCNKVAPTELIGTFTSYYKQFAPTELEEVFTPYVRVICEEHVLITYRSLIRSRKIFYSNFKPYHAFI